MSRVIDLSQRIRDGLVTYPGHPAVSFSPWLTREDSRAHYAPGTDWYIDHWVAEHWDGERWILSDAQMDPVQVKEFGIDFDPADVPRDKFVVAGRAWTAHRAGEIDAGKCGLPGIPGESGPWWIAANLIRDAAALSNMELLPWDVWGSMPEPEDEITPDLVALLDELALPLVPFEHRALGHRLTHLGHLDLDRRRHLAS